MKTWEPSPASCFLRRSSSEGTTVRNRFPLPGRTSECPRAVTTSLITSRFGSLRPPGAPPGVAVVMQPSGSSRRLNLVEDPRRVPRRRLQTMSAILGKQPPKVSGTGIGSSSCTKLHHYCSAVPADSPQQRDSGSSTPRGCSWTSQKSRLIVSLP